MAIPGHYQAIIEDAVAESTASYGLGQEFAVKLALHVGQHFDPDKLGDSGARGYVQRTADHLYDRLYRSGGGAARVPVV